MAMKTLAQTQSAIPVITSFVCIIFQLSLIGLVYSFFEAYIKDKVFRVITAFLLSEVIFLFVSVAINMWSKQALLVNISIIQFIAEFFGVSVQKLLIL